MHTWTEHIHSVAHTHTHQSCHVVLEFSTVGGRVCWCPHGDMPPSCTNLLRPPCCLLVCVLPHAPHSWHGMNRLWLPLSLSFLSLSLSSCWCFVFVLTCSDFTFEQQELYLWSCQSHSAIHRSHFIYKYYSNTSESDSVSFLLSCCCWSFVLKLILKLIFCVNVIILFHIDKTYKFSPPVDTNVEVGTTMKA